MKTKLLLLTLTTICTGALFAAAVVLVAKIVLFYCLSPR
jgi:hypothetical protein